MSFPHVQETIPHHVLSQKSSDSYSPCMKASRNVSEIMMHPGSSIRSIHNQITQGDYENIGFVDKIHLFSLFGNDLCIRKIKYNLFWFCGLSVEEFISAVFFIQSHAFWRIFPTSLHMEAFWKRIINCKLTLGSHNNGSKSYKGSWLSFTQTLIKISFTLKTISLKYKRNYLDVKCVFSHTFCYHCVFPIFCPNMQY